MERNKNQTELRLISALEELIVDKGFEKLGVRAVAEKAGVDKTLIYRYFGSLDGLIYECLKRQDFWTNLPIDLPDTENIKDYLKELFRKQIFELRNNDIFKRMIRWELSNDNAFVKKLRNQREENGLKRIEMISEITKIPCEELASLSSIITGSICYLIMAGETCRYYNGIDITDDNGWEQLIREINKIIDLTYR